MYTEFPKMLYWQGGRTQGRVVQNAAEEQALNKEGWFFARPLDDQGNPIWPDKKEKGVTLPAKELPSAALKESPSAPVAEEKPPVAATEEAADLEAMTKTAIAVYAKTRFGLELLPDTMTKAAMIAAIKAA